jgi:cullin 1
MRELLDNIVLLFNFLEEKDLFLEVYRNLLARRLLTEKSEDIEMEKQLITNLKMACGMSAIRKLEGMIADLSLAKEE